MPTANALPKPSPISSLIKMDKIGLAPAMATTGGGSDANVFFEHGIAALPVGIGVRDFHTTRETANLSEIYDAARVCQEFIRLK